MMFDICRNSPQVERSLLEGLAVHGSATVHEAMGRRGAMDGSIKPLDPRMRVCGTALTVRCPPGDNLMLVKAVSMARPGDVLVVQLDGSPRVGPFGEVLAVECACRGAAGVVVDGSVRDSREIIRLGLPVFCAGIAITGTAKASLGSINHPISCGGETVRPGDVILGDADGLVVLPPDSVADVAAAADRRVAKEADVMAKLREGKSLFELYGYQKILDSLGCKSEV